MLRTIFIIISLCTTMACSETQNKIETGDILFRGKGNGTLSEAIDKVTQNTSKTHFTHIGIAQRVGSQVYVLHAAPEKGVSKEPIEKFCTDKKGEHLGVSVYRLKTQFRPQIEEALKRAGKLLGQKYNYSYILEDSGFYCSEYIQQIFDNKEIFKLEPMTFKDPATNKYYPTWIEHYKKLNIDIPEGRLGCNPNGLSASSAIEYQFSF